MTTGHTQEELLAAFPPPPSPEKTPSVPISDATFEQKWQTLDPKWKSFLDTTGANLSERDLGLCDGLVSHGFTREEIWQILESSPRFWDRVGRKGERHTRDLYELEIKKALEFVTVLPQHHRPSLSFNFPRLAYEPPLLPGSFVSQYVGYMAKYNDTPPEANELFALGVMSALAGRRPRLGLSHRRGGVPLTLWVMYLAPSSEGRKSVVMKAATDILTETLDKNCLVSFDGSPQAFVQRMAADQELQMPTVFTRDEYAGMIKNMHNREYQSGLATTLIKGYDGDPIRVIRTRKRDEHGQVHQDEDNVKEPHLVQLVATTRIDFVSTVTAEDISSGYFARMLFADCLVDRKPQKPESVEQERDFQALKNTAMGFRRRAQQVTKIPVSQEVLDACFAWEKELYDLADSTPSPETVRPLLIRIKDSVLKVCGLLAIDTMTYDKAEVTLTLFQTVKQMAARWVQHAIRIALDIGGTEFAKTADAVHRVIVRHPHGITHRDLSRMFRGLKSRELREVITVLLDREYITEEEERNQHGRRTYLYKPVPEKTA